MGRQIRTCFCGNQRSPGQSCTPGPPQTRCTHSPHSRCLRDSDWWSPGAADRKLVPTSFLQQISAAPELKYSAFDRSLQTLYLAIHHLRYFLEGRAFTALTDHKPFTFALAKISDLWSAHQQRHLSYILECTTNVKHISGKDNVVANSLSRHSIHSLVNGLDFTVLAETQQQDDKILQYRTAVTGLWLQDVPVGTGTTTLLCNVATRQVRSIVPMAWRE
ncbi:uncharacterized protein [Narcine bancroftii]|uniref:uncharacterized protein isoform X1 n=1 Tax=Narcine bancroftii TaxID=1343680 RepID=UPI00383176E5